MKPEEQLEQKCSLYARSKGIASVKLEKNGNKGIPDRVFILRGGRSIYVEFKRPDGRGVISSEQRYWANYIGDENHYFIDNLDDFKTIIKNEKANNKTS